MDALEIDQVFKGVKFLAQVGEPLFKIVELLSKLNGQMSCETFLELVEHGLYLL